MAITISRPVVVGREGGKRGVLRKGTVTSLPSNRFDTPFLGTAQPAATAAVINGTGVQRTSDTNGFAGSSAPAASSCCRGRQSLGLLLQAVPARSIHALRRGSEQRSLDTRTPPFISCL